MRAGLATSLILAACVGDPSQAPDDASSDDAAPQDAATADAAPPGSLLGSFQLTYYWITSEEDYPDPPDTDIFDSSCAALATVSLAFADDLALEGTGRLVDGRVLNYDGACPCAYSPCFAEVDADRPWGVGVMNRPLVPFRSIAVDPAVLDIGASYYVLEFDGVTMPGDAPWGAFVHDGCVVADDQGGGIDGAHIDFFATVRSATLDLDEQLGLDDVTLFEGGARCP